MKIFKRLFIIVMFLGVVFSVIFCVQLGTRFSRDAESAKQLMKRLTPGTVEYETYKRWNKRSDAYYARINMAKGYIEKSEYDHAINEYNEALKMNYNQWMTHENLLEVYEKAGYHDLAIQEIEWLLSRKPSQQAVDEFISRKKKLEEALKGIRNE